MPRVADPNASEETIARTAAAKESRERKRAAINTVLAFVAEVKEQHGLPKEVEDAIARVKGAVRTTGASTKRIVVVDFIKENGPVNEDQIFIEFKLGRQEMRLLANDLIKKVSDPTERIWLAFDNESCNYEVVAEGETMPDGWNGYKPIEVEDV